MRDSVRFAYHYLLSKSRAPFVTHSKIRQYLENRKVVGEEKNCSADKINNIICEAILLGEPFLAGRFGAVELRALRTFDFEVTQQYKGALEQLNLCAGFFPPTEEMGMEFKNLMKESVGLVDVMAIWMLPFESYYIKRYGKKDVLSTYLLDLEPWSSPEKPWSAALKGKKVLVIHPFAETIQAQYARREKIFPRTDILPEFELITLKAVQTIAGEKDSRFETWFDALEWMYHEAMKIDFDIAIIGCGAYGFPLAARIKRAGKQAIHLAGATQLLFGIRGKRWDTDPAFEYVRKWYNDAWVYPGEADKPKNANNVEGGCYW